MNPDKNKPDTKKQAGKKSPDAVETPPPPQHMDPSKTPAKEKKDHPAKKVSE